MLPTIEDFLNLQIGDISSRILIEREEEAQHLLDRMKQEGLHGDMKNIREIDGEIRYYVRLSNLAASMLIGLDEVHGDMGPEFLWSVTLLIDRDSTERRSTLRLSAMYNKHLALATQAAFNNAKTLLQL